MVRGTLERVLGAEQLNQFYERTANNQYTRELLFSTVYELMSDVVFRLLVAAQSATEVVPVERPTKLRESRDCGSHVSPTDHHVLLLCRALDKHRGTAYQRTLGLVKAEKISHIVESHLGIDLGRKPMRDAAGPVDYPHLRRNVFHRAKYHFFAFEVQQRESGSGHYFEPLTPTLTLARYMNPIIAYNSGAYWISKGEACM
jgi:hypothetical protein